VYAPGAKRRPTHWVVSSRSLAAVVGVAMMYVLLAFAVTAPTVVPSIGWTRAVLAYGAPVA
jgi:hypothetical protein